MPREATSGANEHLTGLRLGALGAYLSKHGMALDPAHLPERFAAGFGNMNFLVKINGTSYVLRRPPHGPIPPGANDMAREFRIISHLNPVFPLVPRGQHFCGDTNVIGAPFLLMEYRPGLVIGANIPTDVTSTWHCNQPLGQVLGRHLIGVLADLHAVDAGACGLGNLGKPDGFLERTMRGWAKRAVLSWDDLPNDFAALLRWLAANRPPETDAPTLIHNDFKLDNIILDPGTFAPRTLIDWDMGTIGDPLFDLAILLSYWTEATDPEAMHLLEQMPTAQHGFPTREEAAMLYARATGRDLGTFTFYRVLAMLRLAVVFQQLFRRYQSGSSTDPKFARFDELARGLLSFGLAVSRGETF